MALGKKKEPDDPAEFIARKDYKKAVSILKDRLAKQPKNSNNRLSLADTLLVSGQTEEAVREYKNLAAQYKDEGFLVKAIAIYKKILKLRPGDPDAALLLSNLTDMRVEPPKSRPIVMMEMDESEDMDLGDIGLGAAATSAEPDAPVIELGADAIIESIPPAAVELETTLFRDLTREEFQDVVAMLVLRHYEEDTIVVQEGDPGDSMYVVVRGQVRVLTRDNRQNEIVLANLGEGEFFGEVALLTGRPRTATIITNLSTELLELSSKDLETISARFPHVRTVLEEFHQQRAYKTIETMIQSLRDLP